MGKIKKLVISLCLISSITISAPTLFGNVDAASTAKDTHVYLKINDYYVLYTVPKAPYLDQNNRLLIPLRSISELLGAKVGYNETTKVATIEMENITVTYQVDSKKVTVNGIETTLDTKPVLHQNSIFIPLSSLIKNLSIKSNWSQADKLYTLTGGNLMKTDKVKNWEELNNFSSAPADRTDAFRPLSYNYNTSKNTISIRAKNITGADVDAGKEDVHPYFIYGESIQSDNKNRTRPFVKKDDTLELTWTLNPGVINGAPETLQYILIQGRILK